MTRCENRNECVVVYEDGEMTGKEIPKEILNHFEAYGIVNPYEYK